MAIEKTSFKVSRLDLEFSSRSRESMSSEDDELQRPGSAVESDDDDEFNDCDSGVGSDDFDLLELGEVGEEFCQVGDQTCSIPFELYDLLGLGDVLSMDVWNECLTEGGNSDTSVSRTPVDLSKHLTKNNGESVSQLENSRVIRSLMYLINYTRPNIAYSVSGFSRYTSNPNAIHWKGIMRVLDYLRYTLDYGLHYTRYPAVY